MATKKATTTKKSSASSTKKKSSTKATAAAKTAPVTKSSGFSDHITQSLKSVGLWRALAAELIGTFLLAGVVIAGQGQPIFVLFGVIGIVLLIAGVSGAHINPAVTVGAWVTRRIGWLRAVGYILAQLLGAALAFVVLSYFIGGAPAVSEEAALYGQTGATLFAAAAYAAYEGSEWYVFFAELLGAAVLGYAVANASREGKDRMAQAFTVGAGLFIGLMFAISAAGYVGASSALNPAIALSLNAYSWVNLWPLAIYAAGPILGGVLGFILHDVVTPKK